MRASSLASITKVLAVALLATLAFTSSAFASFPHSHNPVVGWSPSRVDQGVDGTLANPYYAPLKSKIVMATASDAGWGLPGHPGGLVAARVLSGSLQGAVVSVAEGVRPVPGRGVGATVYPGQKIALRASSPFNGIFGNIETFFANPSAPSQPLAQTFPGYFSAPQPHDQSVQAITAGEAMNRLIHLTGGRTGTNSSGHSPNYLLLPAFMRKALGL